MANPTLIVPDPSLWAISVKAHLDGDVVLETITDTRTGATYVIARTLAGAEEIATLLQTAVESPRIGAMADQFRAAQRDRNPGR